MAYEMSSSPGQPGQDGHPYRDLSCLSGLRSPGPDRTLAGHVRLCPVFRNLVGRYRQTIRGSKRPSMSRTAPRCAGPVIKGDNFRFLAAENSWTGMAVASAWGKRALNQVVGTCAKSQIKLSAISIRQGGYRYPFCAGKSDCKRNWAHAENLCGV